MKRKVSVVVLCGGPSSERDVSLSSGRTIAKTLDPKRYHVRRIELSADPRRILSVFANPKTFAGAHVALIALHGAFGEDGAVQHLLELHGVPYTGSGPTASALGMDKEQTMKLARAQGLRVPDFIVVRKGSPLREQKKMLTKAGIGYPCVVKPNGSGSSVGVSIAHNARELAAALRLAFHEDTRVIIQRYIRGRELTCGVMGNAGSLALALPPVEIISSETFFDYQAKYHSKETRELCPAPVSANVTRDIKHQAVAAHETLGCDGLTRSDFILGKNNKLYFLEINTIPGMTPASLCPKEAAALGWSFGEFLDKLIDLAQKKNRS